MGKASDMAIDDIVNKTATARNIARTKAALPDVPEVVTPEAPSNPIDTLHGMTNGGNLSVPNMAVNAASHIVNNPKLLNTLARVAEYTGKVAPSIGAAAGTLPNLAPDPVATSGTMGGMNPSMQQPGAINGTPTGISPANPEQDFINLMRARAGITGDSGAESFMTGVAPMLQKNAALGSTLQGIPQAYGNAGGAQGMSGILSRLSGLIPGTAAHTYNAEQQAAAAQLATTLGISSQAAQALLPQLMQSQGVAGQQQGVLSQLTGSLVH